MNFEDVVQWFEANWKNTELMEKLDEELGERGIWIGLFFFDEIEERETEVVCHLTPSN